MNLLNTISIDPCLRPLNSFVCLHFEECLMRYSGGIGDTGSDVAV